MISYTPFYNTLKVRGISTYKLIQQYGISRSLLDRLKHNKPISTVTLNDLCIMLSCRVDEILIYVPDPAEHVQYQEDALAFKENKKTLLET
jgi:DNA-binding Xre family transcriptional regulator